MSDLLDWRPATPPGGDNRPPQDILRDVFGFSSFRPGQSEIVEAVCEGAETLAIMPTGGGKSLCYQLPALMRPGVTIVVSPLIALMRDQVSALRALGVAAAAIMARHSSAVTAIGFSHMTCFPALAAAMECSAWSPFGVTM